MKGRILHELHSISLGNYSPMAQVIGEELNAPLPWMRENAAQALHLILHDYSRFAVSTIDSFVQRIIQALLWEIGEQGGLDIQLDNQYVLGRAAENLLDSASQSDELMKWLVRMGENLMDSGKSWDVRGKLIELGNELFTESFRLMDRDEVERFSRRENVTTLKAQLNKMVDGMVNGIRAEAEGAICTVQERGLSMDSFSYGERGVMGFFKKCSGIDNSKISLADEIGTRVISAFGDPSGRDWVTKTTSSNATLFPHIQQLVKGVLHPSLTRLLGMVKSYTPHYVAAKLVLSNIENLALLADLWAKVRELSRDEGFLLLSDSGHLLREFVKGSDAPFVFERVGTRFDCFMIDEFQDTSVVQWHNFKPLIENSLSQGKFSMIVGDVKQSIYRWRNGDWRILASGVKHDFNHLGVRELSLGVNRRSLPAIVNFNNAAFQGFANTACNAILHECGEAHTELGNELANQVKEAYRDVMQGVTTSEAAGMGYVQVSMIDAESSSEYSQAVCKRLIILIESLRERYSPGDIAILVRSKRDGQRVASMILEHNRVTPNSLNRIAFVSQDSLQLKVSAVVRVMVNAITLIHNPSNGIARGVLAKELDEVSGVARQQWHSLFTASELEAECQWLAGLHTRPLLEAFEAIAARYRLVDVTNELPYLAELHEHILTLTSRGGNDASAFIHWWEIQGCKIALTVPESANAISIITIHKAKGLEYPVAILPFADWNFRVAGKAPFLWVSANEDPFNMLPKYPIHLKKEAKGSIFARQALEESMQDLVDNLNLLYVALTRPMNELYVYLPNGDLETQKGQVTTTGHLIRATIQNLNLERVEDNDLTIYRQGSITPKPVPRIASHDDQSDWLIDVYPVGGHWGPLRVGSGAKDFFMANPSARLATIGYGRIMHELFSYIKTLEDVPFALHTLERSGLISAPDRPTIGAKVEELLRDDRVCSWFSGEWEVYNETTILTPEGHRYRPDRVMVSGSEAVVVDFKFGAHSAAHLTQLERYANLLSQLGYSRVDAYVWYVDEGSILGLK